MVKRSSGTDIAVDDSIVMWHSVLVVDGQNNVVAVEITNNPLDCWIQGAKAQIVMHKTRSKLCAAQICRYLRRHFEITAMSPVRRCTRTVEAKIGYACAGGYQYEPSERQPGYGLLGHIAAHSIAELLKESARGVNATRIRYTVYEVRSAGRTFRNVTHKYHSVEKRWRYSPPPGMHVHLMHVIGRYETMEQAQKQCDGFEQITDDLWPRFPDVEYIRRLLKLDEHGNIVWTVDSTPAVRPYAVPAVCIGPQVYTERQVRGVLETGEWLDGRKERVS